MSISGMLRASCVGALLFTPAMADDVAQVHEEALRVLRGELGQPNPPAALPIPMAAPAVRVDPELARLRAEREARLKAEAERRMAERERQQAERRVQFEQFVKDRERLRQQQREYNENAALQTGQIPASNHNDIHMRALDALHQAQQINISTPVPAAAPLSVTPPLSDANSRLTPEVARVNTSAPVQPTTTVDVKTPDAPMLMAAAPSSALSSSQVDNSDVHAKALEVLRQSQSSAATTTIISGGASSESPAPTPSPELQRRLKEMQVELEQEQLQKNRGTASAPISDSYARDLERRAQESFQQGSSPAASPAQATMGRLSSESQGLDPSSRAIIERQNQEISKRLSTPAGPSSAPGRGMPSSAPASAASGVGNITTTAPAANPAVTHTIGTDAADIQYSRELEARARQALLERAGVNAQSPAMGVVQTPSTMEPRMVTPERVQIVPSVSPAPQGVHSADPQARAAASAAMSSASTSDSDVHARALETLNQARSGAPMAPSNSKMQRLKELTDLYRADKMGPPEYHQKRAQILAEPQ